MMSKIKQLTARIESGEATEVSSSERIMILEENLRLKSEDLNASRKDNENIRLQTEEKVLYIQLQLNNMRSKDEQNNLELIALKKELEEKSATINSVAISETQNKDIIEKLQNKIFEYDDEIISYRTKISENEKNLNASKLLKDEKESLLLAMRKDLKTVLDGKEVALKKVHEMEEYKLKLDHVNIKLTGDFELCLS